MWNVSIFSEPEAWIALLTLTAMEVVLGIDNIVFLSIVSDRLPAAQQVKARQIGLSLALVMRLGLLFAISWIMGLTRPILPGPGGGFSGRDLILGIGGLFLIWKSTHEIFAKLEVSPEHSAQGGLRQKTTTFGSALLQILALDLVFSLDSVITAVGMSQHILVMIIAMVLAVVVMLVFAGAISDFVNRHPSMQVLALAFLLLIGVMLVAESLGQHVDKKTIYFAMAFSLGVEIVNMRMRRRQQPVHLHPGPRAPE